MPQTLVELGGAGDAPVLHLGVANGFPPQTYLPLVRALAGYRALSLPPRVLWSDQAPPASYIDWRRDADDLLAGLESHDLRDIVAVGHSLGGVVSMLALIEEPARFKALIMLDPPILPPEMIAMIGTAWQEGWVDELPLVTSALRRRRHFESRQDAFNRFRNRPLFADWSDESLLLYIKHGLRGCVNGGFELTWSVEWEAHYFSTVYTDIWRDLPKLNGIVPTLIIRADDGDTFPVSSYERARMMLPDVDFHLMRGRGHLFPLAVPRESAEVMREWLRSL